MYFYLAKINTTPLRILRYRQIVNRRMLDSKNHI